MDAKLLSIFHTVCRTQSPELVAFHSELRANGVVYAFTSTEELLAAWRLARVSDAAQSFTPTAVVWLQARPGEYRQREIDVVAECDPLARPIIVAGCLSEGEPRSGRPLSGAARIYWHQGAGAVLSLISRRTVPQKKSAEWIAIHTRQYIDYQALAAICQAAGQRTLWQSDAWPIISSEPAVRLFQGWDLWQHWQQQTGNQRDPGTRHLLLQGFPRPSDHEQAAREGIECVLAQPCTLRDLQRALAAVPRSFATISPAAEQVPLKSNLRATRRYLQSA